MWRRSASRRRTAEQYATVRRRQHRSDRGRTADEWVPDDDAETAASANSGTIAAAADSDASPVGTTAKRTVPCDRSARQSSFRERCW
jgi:hypothetical protein